MNESSASSLPHTPPRPENVAHLGMPERVWAVGSLYGRYGSLCQLHEALSQKISPGDRVVYLGNYLGATSQWSGEGKAVLGELIAFASALDATEGFSQNTAVFLRGRMEDLCRQLMRLPFQKDAVAWADEAMERGLGAYLAAYSVNPQALTDAASAGPFVANRFTYYWQQIVAGHAGHEAFMSNLFDAARTETHRPTAFIAEGLDPRLPLSSQRETLCWPASDIAALPRYFNFGRVVRGSGGLALDDKALVLSLDGGNRIEGNIHAACLNGTGHVIESLTF